MGGVVGSATYSDQRFQAGLDDVQAFVQHVVFDGDGHQEADGVAVHAAGEQDQTLFTGFFAQRRRQLRVRGAVGFVVDQQFPVVGVTSPATIFINVDFPAPLWP